MFYERENRYVSSKTAQQLFDEEIETNKYNVAVHMSGMKICAKGFHRRKASYGIEKQSKK